MEILPGLSKKAFNRPKPTPSTKICRHGEFVTRYPKHADDRAQIWKDIRLFGKSLLAFGKTFQHYRAYCKDSATIVPCHSFRFVEQDLFKKCLLSYFLHFKNYENVEILRFCHLLFIKITNREYHVAQFLYDWF